MRILLIARGYPTENDPQWGCFELDQAKALRKLGHDVAIMAVDRRWLFKCRKPGISKKIIDGLPIFHSFFTPHVFIPQFNYRLREYYMRITFKSVIKTWGKPDVIYSHFLNNTSAILPVAQDYKIPVVALEHWSKLMKHPIPKEVLYTGKNTYGKNGLKLLSVSENLRRALLDNFNSDSKVVPNMIGEEFLINPDTEKYKKFTFVAIGSLIHRKGFDLLIEAAAKLKKAGIDDWNIIIIGGGNEKENILNLISKYNLNSHIKLVGSKNKDEIREYLSKSHAFVLPSRSETFGVVYIEAMAMGLPVIATDCGIPEDLINNSNGLVCPVEDIEEISKSMLYIMNNIEKFDSSHIRDYCLGKYSPQIVAKQIETELIKAINE